jgi:5-methylcytosine-specific restriction endonuclease McrA
MPSFPVAMQTLIEKMHAGPADPQSSSDQLPVAMSGKTSSTGLPRSLTCATNFAFFIEMLHFPVRYLKSFSDLPSAFVYYEPRDGGDQVYFGTGEVLCVYEDTEDVGHAYAEIGGYREFPYPVNFYSAPGGGTWENAKTMRNSVRQLAEDVFNSILSAGGVAFGVSASPSKNQSILEAMRSELESYPGPGKRSVPVLKRIRRILESYERPSAITNLVKRTRGDSCQLCGTRGFLKRDGTRYCEVHHLFHLAEDPPSESLSPDYLAVLCATCHRRMHYADVGKPIATPEGWEIKIDGGTVIFTSRSASSRTLT